MAGDSGKEQDEGTTKYNSTKEGEDYADYEMDLGRIL